VIRLYSGSGSGEVILDDPMPDVHWQKLRTSTIRLLARRGRSEAAKPLTDIPFALYDGHNGFGDEFKVLVWFASIDRYAEASDWPSDPDKRSVFKEIAVVVGEMVESVRFVVIQADHDAGAPAVTAPRLQTTSDFYSGCTTTITSQGKFRAPLPPAPSAPCTADAKALCAVQESNVNNGQCNLGGVNVHGAPLYITAYKTTYYTFKKSAMLELQGTSTETQTVPSTKPCTLTTRWSPAEPKIAYGDPNLP
jgi:hypothetical protein